jgi:hypothetical protein
VNFFTRIKNMVAAPATAKPASAGLPMTPAAPEGRPREQGTLARANEQQARMDAQLRALDRAVNPAGPVKVNEAQDTYLGIAGRIRASATALGVLDQLELEGVKIWAPVYQWAEGAAQVWHSEVVGGRAFELAILKKVLAQQGKDPAKELADVVTQLRPGWARIKALYREMEQHGMTTEYARALIAKDNAIGPGNPGYAGLGAKSSDELYQIIKIGLRGYRAKIVAEGEQLLPAARVEGNWIKAVLETALTQQVEKEIRFAIDTGLPMIPTPYLTALNNGVEMADAEIRQLAGDANFPSLFWELLKEEIERN